MIKIKKYIFTFIFLAILSFQSLAEENISIAYKINNEIITNIDIKKESSYLIALNNQLKNLDKKKILGISKESAIREKIKKIELQKYITLNKENLNINKYIKNFYLKLGLSNEVEFREYLKNYNVTLNYVEKKMLIEVAWNQLIYEKYKNQINIDINKLKEQIKKNKNKNDKKVYLLSEIIFEKNNQDKFDEKIKNINESIKEIGFKNTANIYSISDSAKFGGDIGWIEEEKLSRKILNKLTKLKVGDSTLPFQIGGSFLVLKVEKIKYEKKIFDENQELKQKIQFETSRQLDQFSKIYYNKIKINTNINEL